MDRLFWIGRPVKVIGSTKYTSIEEVWEDKQYMAGIGGAPCTATSARYWNRVRKYFPAVFKRRCEQSRRLGVRLVRYKGVRIFLDELPEDATDQIAEDLSCGPQCAVARMEND